MLPAFLLYCLLEIRQRNFGGCYLPDDPGCNLHCCWCVIYYICRTILKFGGYGFPHITFPSMLTSTDLDLWSRIFDDCDSCYIIYKSYAVIIPKVAEYCHDWSHGWCLVPLVITHALEWLFNFVYMADLHMLVFINCISLVWDITGLLYFIWFHIPLYFWLCVLLCILHKMFSLC